MDEMLTELTTAANKLRAADERRKNQQAYLDHLIHQATQNGIGWNQIKQATGLHNRSLQLAMKRIKRNEK